jgi:arsenic resistance protein ArsH
MAQQLSAKSAHPDRINRSQRTPSHLTLALRLSEDDPHIRQKYRPFIFCDDAAEDWVDSLELTTALNMAENNVRLTNERLKVLVLYGSLQKRSYSRLVAFEAARILFRLGCDVRVFDPEGLPVKNDSDQAHPKVQELRELSSWSDGHVWISPEQHGNLVSIFSCLSLIDIQISLMLFSTLDSGIQEPD